MLNITELAANKVKEIMASQNKENSFLRVYVAGVGCSGPNFGMALDESKTDDDDIIEEHGITIVADQKFTPYLEDAVIDYIESEEGSGFEIRTSFESGCGSCSSGCRG
ncbi:MAG: iron-sulfur cluster assembly accessory protein [Peptococcaceae bacterium]|jgi:iron-sulfur cluster assembly protein|nr:iron-sulfur cluster assembly accessory protein [Peptococcaceae bacterium]